MILEITEVPREEGLESREETQSHITSLGF